MTGDQPSRPQSEDSTTHTEVELTHLAPFHDDHAEATDRVLEMIVAIDFLRRGDRRGLTLWAAFEEALRWWAAERAALLDGYAEPSPAFPELGGCQTLPSTLMRFVAVAGQDEPVHLHTALQQAIRRWNSTMADRHNDGHPWPPPHLTAERRLG